MEIISQLNRNLRLACDGRQWILQAARGRPTAKNTGWRSFKFLTSRRGLEIALRSSLPDLYQGSIEMWVEGLPEILPSRSAIEWSASFRRPDGLPPYSLRQRTNQRTPLWRPLSLFGEQADGRTILPRTNETPQEGDASAIPELWCRGPDAQRQ